MTPTDIAVRPARPGDARAIAAMSRDLIETGLGWQYHPERVSRLIGDPDTVALVASDHGHIVGFAIMDFGEERAHLLLLAVRPSHRRQGAGRQMFQWLLESAATAGIVSVHLELRAANQAARAFYRAMGFTETLLLPGYYRGREAAMRMVRVLRAPGPPAVIWRPPSLDRR